MAAERRVIISTAALVEISHFDMISSFSQRSLSTLGITVRASPHIFISIPDYIGGKQGFQRKRQVLIRVIVYVINVTNVKNVILQCQTESGMKDILPYRTRRTKCGL